MVAADGAVIASLIKDLQLTVATVAAQLVDLVPNMFYDGFAEAETEVEDADVSVEWLVAWRARFTEAMLSLELYDELTGAAAPANNIPLCAASLQDHFGADNSTICRQSFDAFFDLLGFRPGRSPEPTRVRPYLLPSL